MPRGIPGSGKAKRKNAKRVNKKGEVDLEFDAKQLKEAQEKAQAAYGNGAATAPQQSSFRAYIYKQYLVEIRDNVNQDRAFRVHGCEAIEEVMFGISSQNPNAESISVSEITIARTLTNAKR